MITNARITEITAQLTDAGDSWPATAAAIPEIDEALPGDDQYRDRCRLTDNWARPLTRGGELTCPPMLYRNEATGQWHGQGASSASAAQLFRPRPVWYDEDAGTWRPRWTGTEAE